MDSSSDKGRPVDEPSGRNDADCGDGGDIFNVGAGDHYVQGVDGESVLDALEVPIASIGEVGDLDESVAVPESSAKLCDVAELGGWGGGVSTDGDDGHCSSSHVSEVAGSLTDGYERTDANRSGSELTAWSGGEVAEGEEAGGTLVPPVDDLLNNVPIGYVLTASGYQPYGPAHGYPVPLGHEGAVGSDVAHINQRYATKPRHPLTVGTAVGLSVLLVLFGAMIGVWVQSRRDLNVFSSAPVSTVSPPSAATAAAVAKRLDPSIVDIAASSPTQVNAGTGIILSSNGLVLTNNHVIRGETSITARVSGSGPTYSGTVIGDDPTADVAVVQLKNAHGLTPAKIANSANVVVGTKVVAIGNALDLPGNPAVTTGVVVGIDKSINASDHGLNPESLTGMLESTTILQPGNSGGPLVTLNGEVVGMNTAASGDSLGVGTPLGYAIPIKRALSIESEIISNKASTSVQIGPRGAIGVLVENLSPTGSGGSYTGPIAPANNGVLVIDVDKGSPAAAAGIVDGSVITNVDNVPIKSLSTLEGVMSQVFPNEKVPVSWTSPDGKTYTETLTLAVGTPD